MRDSFVFYASFLEAIDCLPEKEQLEVYRAIAKYGIENIDLSDEISPIAKAMFLMAKPQLDANIKKREVGKRGGRPKNETNDFNNDENEKPMVIENEQNEKPKVIEKENQKKPKVIESEQNKKPNANANANVNANVNKKEKDKKEIQLFWNERAKALSLSQISKLTNARNKKLNARLKENPNFIENFKLALEKISSSRFLQGENDRGWKVDFDWLIANDTNILKVIEGKYDDNSKPNAHKSRVDIVEKNKLEVRRAVEMFNQMHQIQGANYA